MQFLVDFSFLSQLRGDNNIYFYFYSPQNTIYALFFHSNEDLRGRMNLTIRCDFSLVLWACSMLVVENYSVHKHETGVNAFIFERASK